MQSAKPVRLAAGGMLFCDEKWAKGFLGQDGDRLAAGRSLLQGLASTPRRRGVPFTRVRRRGLRSMSGRYPYGLGNPPTLRRSSFPQRASRPAGGPIPKHTWGCAPRPPNAKLRLDTNDAKHRPYSAADTLIRCLRRILCGVTANQQQKVMLPGLSFFGATKTPYE